MSESVSREGDGRFVEPVNDFIRRVADLDRPELIHEMERQLGMPSTHDRVIEAATRAMSALMEWYFDIAARHSTTALPVCRQILKLAAMIEKGRDTGHFRAVHQYEDLLTEIEAEDLGLSISKVVKPGDANIALLTSQEQIGTVTPLSSGPFAKGCFRWEGRVGSGIGPKQWELLTSLWDVDAEEPKEPQDLEAVWSAVYGQESFKRDRLKALKNSLNNTLIQRRIPFAAEFTSKGSDQIHLQAYP